jgi:transposase
VHLTEACDADRPELITHVATTLATTQDDAVTGAIHDDLAARRLLPADHLVDAGYTSAEHRVRSRAAHGLDLVGPVAANASWQARAGTGFDLQRFAIEWDTQTVICPQGKRSRSWRPRHHPGGRPQIHVRFDRHDCLACVCRAACTRSTTKPRTLAFQPQAHQVALEAARLRQTTPEFKERYALRAGAESTLSQAIRVGDLRHTRYLGLARTHLQQLIIATAVNVIRTLAWLNEVPRGPTRVSRWVALAAPH